MRKKIKFYRIKNTRGLMSEWASKKLNKDDLEKVILTKAQFWGNEEWGRYEFCDWDSLNMMPAKKMWDKKTTKEMAKIGLVW